MDSGTWRLLSVFYLSCLVLLLVGAGVVTSAGMGKLHFRVFSSKRSMSPPVYVCVLCVCTHYTYIHISLVNLAPARAIAPFGGFSASHIKVLR